MLRIKVLLIVMIIVLALIFTPSIQSSRARSELAFTSPETLIEKLRFYLDSSMINWSNNYYGLIFNEQSVTDFENYVDYLAEIRDWKNVLAWSACLNKIGVERERAIIDALGNLTKAGELPTSGIDDDGNYWHVYDRDLLYATYYYANQYRYSQKWNLTRAYNFLKGAIEANSSYPGFLKVHADGQIAKGDNRFYDENAQTLSAYLIFHELGIDSALNEARQIWTHINDNHWNDIHEYYNYSRVLSTFECESPYFVKIVSLIQWFDKKIGNRTRLSDDLETRFLKYRWSSPQWTHPTIPPEESAFVVIHDNPRNPQRRLQNTLGAWFTMLGRYNTFSPTNQKNLRAMLKGYDLFPPAWKLLYEDSAKLHDNSTGMFKMVSTDDNATSYATSVSLTLQALLGIVPIDTTIAFPLEEYHYQYNLDIDPNLFRIDPTNNTLRIAISNTGTMEFIYGNSPVTYSFPERGIYEITFSHCWNYIANASKIQNLPSERKFLLSPQGSLDVTGHGNLPDGEVDMKDLAAVAASLGSHGPNFKSPNSPHHPRWNAIADVWIPYHGDNQIDLFDVLLVAMNFGEKYLP